MRKVIRFIERNFDKPLSLQDAAMVASLSPKYLSRLFKEETHKSFTEFRINLRLEKAKELLEKTRLTVKEISDRTGYDTAEAFEKVFKKFEGLTPTEYRRRDKTSVNRIPTP